MDKKSYIKEHSWSGFKSGIKYSSYVYLGATIASLLISLTIAPIFPFVLLVSNPVAWAVLGVAFIVLSGLALAIIKPLFHLAYDNINKEKYQIEAPSSLLNGVEVNREELLRSSENFVSETIKGNYGCWLTSNEIEDIAEKKYGYLNEDNVVMFGVWPLYHYKEKVDSSSEKIRKRIESLGKDSYFEVYRDRIKETGEPTCCTLILGLKDHWVTLTIAYDNESKRFRAYYCNPFGGTYNGIDRELLKCLEEGKFFSLRKEDIRVNKTKQQKNGYDCGIYALESAKIMTDMMKEGRSFDDIDKKLAEYVHADKEQEEKRLQGKREEFARVLINDMSRMSDSDFKQKIEGYERA